MAHLAILEEVIVNLNEISLVHKCGGPLHIIRTSDGRELEITKKVYSNLVEHIKGLQTSKETSTSSVEELQKSLKCKDDLIDSLQKQLAHQTEMFDVKCKSSVKLANMLGDATAERDRLKAECDKLNAERSTKSMSSTDELNFLRQKNDDLVNRVCALEKERKTILEERDQLKAERDQLKAERDQLKAERDQLKAPSADEFKTAFDDANVTIGILRKRNLDLVEEVNKLAMTLFHATKEMDKVSAERDRLKAELDTSSTSANDAIDNANETIGFWRAAAEKLSKELVQSNDKLERLSDLHESANDRLKVELVEAAKTIAELVSERDRLTAVVTELRDQLNDQKASSADELKSVSDRANETIGYWRQRAGHLADEVEKLSKELRKHEERLFEAAKTITELKQGFKQAAETIQGLVK